MIVKRFFLVLFLFIECEGVQLLSQNNSVELINQVRVLATREASLTLNYKNVDGSPYYTPEFIKGTVYLNNGNYATYPFRYDIFQDEMEFRKDDKIFWLLKNDIKFLRYGSDMVIVTHAVSDTGKLGYFFLKETGKYNIMKKMRVVFYPLVPPKGYSETIPDRFKREEDEFYLQFEGMPAQRLKNNKDLSTVFPDNKPALDFIKKEKIKVNNFESLQKLVNFLNSQ
jgi:hypothetical protein